MLQFSRVCGILVPFERNTHSITSSMVEDLLVWYDPDKEGKPTNGFFLLCSYLRNHCRDGGSTSNDLFGAYVV